MCYAIVSTYFFRMPRKERIKTTTTKTTTPKMLMPFLVPSPPEEVSQG